MDSKKKLIVFCASLIFAFIYWRIRVLFLEEDGLPFLREITGLTIHHYHYGLVILLVAVLFLIFYKVNNLGIGLAGFGIGTVFDSFISRLFSSFGSRTQEIINYHRFFDLTVFLFVNIILLALVFYMIGEKYKK